MLCSYGDCERKALYTKLQLCQKHYDKLRRAGVIERKSKVASKVVTQTDYALLELTNGYWAKIDIKDIIM